MSSTLVDGLETVRVAHGGVVAMESMVGTSGESGLFVRLVSDGDQLVKLAYRDSRSLLTCDVLQNDRAELREFFSKFLAKNKIHHNDLKQDHIKEHLREGEGQFTWEETNDEFMEKHPEYAAMTDIETLKQTCMDWYEARKQGEC